jgi:hypothetical protein
MVRTARVSAGALLPTGRRVILRNYLLRGHRHGSSLEAELWTGFFSFSSFLPSGWCGPTNARACKAHLRPLIKLQRDVGRFPACHSL